MNIRELQDYFNSTPRKAISTEMLNELDKARQLIMEADIRAIYAGQPPYTDEEMRGSAATQWGSNAVFKAGPPETWARHDRAFFNKSNPAQMQAQALTRFDPSNPAQMGQLGVYPLPDIGPAPFPANAGETVVSPNPHEVPPLRAWKVWDGDSCETYTVLVFAPTRNKARKLALGILSLQGADEWVHIRAKREPEADKYAQQFGERALDCGTTEQCRVMRELGYFEIEGNHTPCDVCGLYQWDLVPESRIYEYHEGAYCKTCAPVPAGTQSFFRK